VQRKSDDDWVKQCMNFVVAGPKSRGLKLLKEI